MSLLLFLTFILVFFLSHNLNTSLCILLYIHYSISTFSLSLDPLALLLCPASSSLSHVPLAFLLPMSPYPSSFSCHPSSSLSHVPSLPLPFIMSLFALLFLISPNSSVPHILLALLLIISFSRHSSVPLSSSFFQVPLALLFLMFPLLFSFLYSFYLSPSCV
ncbi:unnamed protein product [Acanthosepion pharaonis]|uniref:Uncharacterized protein n=1 Tax=Acanthosepion pharaonis TaxID=158019 RepID=A0A812AYG3_ACAPH|nr:unnamed protein product [Sepia pharaonis]